MYGPVLLADQPNLISLIALGGLGDRPWHTGRDESITYSDTSY